MKVIALIDFFSVGHHTMFMKLYIKAFMKQKYRILLVFPESQEMRLFLQNKENIIYHVVPPVSGKVSWTRSILNWMVLRKILTQQERKRKITISFVFITWLDNFLYANIPSFIIDMIFPYPWSGLYFHPMHLRTEWKSLSQSTYPFTQECILRAKNCLNVAVLDEGVRERLEKRTHKSVYVLPDLTDESTPDMSLPIIKRIRRQARKRPIVSVLGVMDARKNQELLFHTSRLAEAKKYFFVFAGKMSSRMSPDNLSDFQKAVKHRQHNCFFSLQRIADEREFNSLVYMSDILFLSYVNFPHSSNLLAKAALFKKPVIVSNTYCLAERVKRYRLGKCVSGSDPEELIRAIREITKNMSFYKKNVGFKQYLEHHSFDRLAACVKNMMREGEYRV